MWRGGRSCRPRRPRPGFYCRDTKKFEGAVEISNVQHLSTQAPQPKPVAQNGSSTIFFRVLLCFPMYLHTLKNHICKTFFKKSICLFPKLIHIIFNFNPYDILTPKGPRIYSFKMTNSIRHIVKSSFWMRTNFISPESLKNM